VRINAAVEVAFFFLRGEGGEKEGRRRGEGGEKEGRRRGEE
jgi:hypothetical protein